MTFQLSAKMVQRCRRHLDGFPPQHDKALRTLHQESGELVAQDAFDLIGLLDLNANADGVH